MISIYYLELETGEAHQVPEMTTSIHAVLHVHTYPRHGMKMGLTTKI